jgi:DNA ligase-1
VSKLPKLFSRRSDGKLQEWQVEVSGPKFRALSGIKDGEIVVSEWTECKPKNVGRANSTTAEEQAVREAKALWQKKIDKGYKEKETEVDNIAFFEPMLAKVYEDYIGDVIAEFKTKRPVYVQPKLDGIRCIARADGLWSRNGKPLVSVPHIFKALAPFFKENPDAVLDGELYCDKFSNNFNEICSLVRRTKPTKEELEQAKVMEYWVYDLPSNLPFSNRLESLAKFKFSQPVKVLVTKLVTNTKQIDDWYEQWIVDGYEGQIIRLDKKYESKRTSSLLKRKEFTDKEYEIISVDEGIGNRAGTAGNMVLKLNNTTTFKSNIKGDFAYVSKLLKDRKSLVGKFATVKFFNLTPDGVPRFPFVIGIRDYE